MHGFHALVTMVVGNEIRDTQCGFKLMTRQAAQDIVPQQRLQRWAFDVELIKLAGELGVRGGSAGGAAGGADRVGGDGGKPWTTRA
jgi:hypothetical protein